METNAFKIFFFAYINYIAVFDDHLSALTKLSWSPPVLILRAWCKSSEINQLQHSRKRAHKKYDFALTLLVRGFTNNPINTTKLIN